MSIFDEEEQQPIKQNQSLNNYSIFNEEQQPTQQNKPTSSVPRSPTDLLWENISSPQTPNEPGLMPKLLGRGIEAVAGIAGNIPAGAIGLTNLLQSVISPKSHELHPFPSYETIREKAPFLPPSSEGWHEKGYLGIIPSGREIAKKIYGSEEALEPKGGFQGFAMDIAGGTTMLLTGGLPGNVKNIIKGTETTGGVLKNLGNALFKTSAKAGSGIAMRNVIKAIGGSDAVAGLGELGVYMASNFAPKEVLNQVRGLYNEKYNNVEKALYKYNDQKNPPTVVFYGQDLRKELNHLTHVANEGRTSDPHKRYMQETLKNLQEQVPWQEAGVGPKQFGGMVLPERIDVRSAYRMIKDLNNAIENGQIPPGAMPWVHDLKTKVLKPIIKKWGKINNEMGIVKDFFEGEELFKSVNQASTFRQRINELLTDGRITALSAGFLLGHPNIAGGTMAGAWILRGLTNLLDPARNPEIFKKYIKTMYKGLKAETLAVTEGIAKDFDKDLLKHLPNGAYGDWEVVQ